MPEIIHVEGNGGRLTKLRYKIYRAEECVFSQISSSNKTTSSINLAEEIVDAICKRENLDPEKTKFFDFQTRTAYPGSLGKLNPGEFEYEEIVFDEKGSPSWIRVECPNCVMQDFPTDAGVSVQV